MFCPNCMEQRSWASTRCPKCTSWHSLPALWLFNLLCLGAAVVFLVAVVLMIGGIAAIFG